MTTLISLLATTTLTLLARWTLGPIVLRTLGALLTLAALTDLARGDWPLASALMLVPGLAAWLAGHLLYADRHHEYASPLAERIVRTLQRCTPTRGPRFERGDADPTGTK